MVSMGCGNDDGFQPIFPQHFGQLCILTNALMGAAESSLKALQRRRMRIAGCYNLDVVALHHLSGMMVSHPAGAYYSHTKRFHYSK